MMRYYTVRKAAESDGRVKLEIGFGDPADNDCIVADALTAVGELELRGGRGIYFHGPASLPVAMALSHAVAHLFKYVACFDPKLGAYVVAISHDPELRPGDLLPEFAP